MSRASIQMRRPSAIDVRGWNEIWRLVSRFYDADQNWLEKRLRAQTVIALFRSRIDRRLIGIAAVEFEETSFEGRSVLLIVATHIMIDERFDGAALLQRAARRCWRWAWMDHPLKAKLWLFEAGLASHYVALRDFAAYWPRRDQETPPWEARLLAACGQRFGGTAWREDGIVGSLPQLRWLQSAAARSVLPRDDLDRAYFESRNPKHGDGERLLCLVPLTPANAWHRLRLGFARTLRRWAGMPPYSPPRVKR